ncbi:MAG: hypothetical protein Q3974_00060 [Rothia sp. (in: high G+C Gram-positive bacteria)]|nr:hypothetical protein [Rothia sp. (in: high G+C Gram-positive bacteria)]
MSPQSRRKSSQAVAIGAVTALAMALTGCATDEERETDADYAQICVDEKTQERVEDNQCQDTSHSHSNFGWMWLPFFLSMSNNRANIIPPIGTRLTPDQHATRQRPQNARSTTVPTSGVTPSKSKNGKTTMKSNKSGTSRGGFGSKGGGSGS